MTLSSVKSFTTHDLLSITTLSRAEIEQVTQYKYLGIFIDNLLTFTPHIQNLVKQKTRVRLELSLVYIFSLRKGW